MMRRVMPWLALAVSTSIVSAQTSVHPRDLRMPAPAFRRPDPAAHQHQAGPAVVYIVEDRRVPMVTVRAFVRAGYGSASDAAVPRAVERALRAGPASLGAGAFQREIEQMVGEWRVSMGPELTEISLDVSAEDSRRAIELVAATVRAPRFTDVPAGRAPSVLASASAAGESGPVLYEGSLQLAIDILNEHLLGTTPYGGMATAPVSAATARSFHDSFFGAASTVFSIAGDIGVADARAALAAAVTGWQSGRMPEARTVPTPVPSPAAGREIHLYDAAKLQGWIAMGHPLAPVPQRDRAALEVMNYIIGGGHFDTRLFRELRDKRGLANTGGGYPEWFERGPGTFTFRTYGRPDVIPFLIELTLREVERMRSELVTPDELEIAKGALADGVFAVRYADGYATARSLAEDHARSGHAESASYQQRIRAVTREQVRDVARRYLDPGKFRIVVVGPLDAIARASHPESNRPLSSFGRIEEHRARQ